MLWRARALELSVGVQIRQRIDGGVRSVQYRVAKWMPLTWSMQRSSVDLSTVMSLEELQGEVGGLKDPLYWVQIPGREDVVLAKRQGVPRWPPRPRPDPGLSLCGGVLFSSGSQSGSGTVGWVFGGGTRHQMGQNTALPERQGGARWPPELRTRPKPRPRFKSAAAQKGTVLPGPLIGSPLGRDHERQEFQVPGRPGRSIDETAEWSKMAAGTD